jgi:hypothetical protein
MAERLPMRLKRQCPWCGGDQLYVVPKPQTSDTVRCYNGACDYLELLPDHFLLPRQKRTHRPHARPEIPPGFEAPDHLRSTLARRF